MNILAVSRPKVKSTRHVVRTAAPFGAGIISTVVRGSSLPKTDVDGTSPLPTIDGASLTTAERFRVTGCRNRAKASYAAGCPDATYGEIDEVGRKAATDELRRTLKDRPAAPELKAAEPAVAPVEPAPRVEARRPVASTARRMPYTAADLAWAAATSSTRHFGYDVLVAGPAPIRGGAPVRRNRWDEQAAESGAMDCLERGLIPSDVAEFISRTSLVGHPA